MPRNKKQVPNQSGVPVDRSTSRGLVTPQHDLPVLEGPDAFRAWLRGRCNASSVKEVAAAAGIQPNYLSNILAGRVSLGTETIARWGYEREVRVIFKPKSR